MKKWLSTYGISLALLIALLMLWEGATVLFSIEKWLLPSPSMIVQTGITVFPDLYEHIESTLFLSIVGLLLGSIIGILTASIIHYWPILDKVMMPYLVVSQNIPIIVLAPLLVIWLGFGALPKIIVISLVCFFPVTISFLSGLRETPSSYVTFMKMSGGTKKQLFWKVETPFALPSLFSGLRIAATYSVMGAVISEWLGAQRGIGVFMTLASANFRTDRVFVAIVVVVIISLFYVSLIKWVESFWARKTGRGKTDVTSR
ncbi:ABC transporter permease [Mangrovibacillus cuniculi]|uniref:ABC transporter permease n=1 Tax=Mangrovibacillus cuniculi TaxID=2593652 RepID=A0A7S8C9M2_9BACI|nr:ABC transporter permease [Mangrovibacillus cuniculi]QPC45945.1 ABC transporter permease [Mangrovibacillus cuniculi]